MVSEVKCWTGFSLLTGFSARLTICLVLVAEHAGGFHLHGDIRGMEERHRWRSLALEVGGCFP